MDNRRRFGVVRVGFTESEKVEFLYRIAHIGQLLGYRPVVVRALCRSVQDVMDWQRARPVREEVGGE